MKTIYFTGAMLICCLAAYGQAKDSLTGLPLIPAAETIMGGKSLGFQPTVMPEGAICKSKMKGNFYAIGNMNVKANDVKVSAVTAWYAAHLPGFKKVQGYESTRSQTAFYTADGKTVVIITGERGRQGDDVGTYAVAYERYEPGLAENTIISLTQGKIVCK